MKRILSAAAAIMLLVTVCAANSAHKEVRYENGRSVIEFYDGEQFIQGYVVEG